MQWSLLAALVSAISGILVGGQSVGDVQVTVEGKDLRVCTLIKNAACAAPPDNSCATNPIRDCSCFTNVNTDGNAFTRNIQPDLKGPQFKAMCVPGADGRIWTAILFREGLQTTGVVSFDRTFAEYQQGFGSQGDFYSGDFFLGLDRTHNLTKAVDMQLQILLVDKSYSEYTTYYDHFLVGDSQSQYTLSLGARNDLLSNGPGLAATLFSSDSDGQKFYTKDKDNSQQCAAKHKGGWWMRPKSYSKACSNLNAHGPYSNPGVANTMAFDVNESRVEAAAAYFLITPPK